MPMHPALKALLNPFGLVGEGTPDYVDPNIQGEYGKDMKEFDPSMARWYDMMLAQAPGGIGGKRGQVIGESDPGSNQLRGTRPDVADLIDHIPGQDMSQLGEQPLYGLKKQAADYYKSKYSGGS